MYIKKFNELNSEFYDTELPDGFDNNQPDMDFFKNNKDINIEVIENALQRYIDDNICNVKISRNNNKFLSDEKFVIISFLPNQQKFSTHKQTKTDSIREYARLLEDISYAVDDIMSSKSFTKYSLAYENEYGINKIIVEFDYD